MKFLNIHGFGNTIRCMNPQKVISNVADFLISPRFASLLGVALATMQLLQAVDMMRSSAKSQKRIGFNDET